VSLSCGRSIGDIFSPMNDNRHDFNHELGGETFAEVRPGWQTESIMDEWAHYAQSQMGEL
jgi:hypothetical protein